MNSNLIVLHNVNKKNKVIVFPNAKINLGMIYQKGKFPMFKKSKPILSGHGKFEESIEKIKKYFSNN